MLHSLTPYRTILTMGLSLLILLIVSRPVWATAPRIAIKTQVEDTQPHLIAYAYPPLVNVDANHSGAVVELVKQAFAITGQAVNVEVLPSRTLAQQLLSSDSKVMGLLGESLTMAATDHKNLSEVKCLQLTGRYFYYVPALGQQLGKVHDSKQLKGYRYGAAPGEPLGTVEKLGLHIAVDEPKLLWRKLQAREIDLLSAYEPYGLAMIASELPGEQANFATLPMTAWKSPFSVWFPQASKMAQTWRTALATGLNKIIASGEYARILTAYGIDSQAAMP